MRPRVMSWLLALVCLAAAGCIFETARRDGAACSVEKSCPPGQQCSADGQCLYPCPAASCVDSDCGCSGIDRGDIAKGGGGWTCKGDNLCHFLCQDMSGGAGSCQGYMHCDNGAGVCRPACSDGNQCANGATCVPASGPGNLPPGMCVGQWHGGDGGVGDGGKPDGGWGDGGTWVQCNSIATDVSSNPNHCGACNHSCQGGDCLGGKCQPYKLASPSGMFNVQAIAIDGSDVFFYDSTTDLILRCGKPGCGTATQLTPGTAGGVAALACDPNGANFYWASMSDGKIHSCPKTGCIGTPVNLSNHDGRGIAADGGWVYFVSGNVVKRCASPDCNGGATPLSPAGAGSTWAVAADGVSIFWANFGMGSGDGSVSMCPRTGCTGAPTVLAANESSPAAFAFSPDGSSVYWRSSSAISWCAKTGCGGVPHKVTDLPFDSPLPGTDRLAVAAHGIYWDHNGGLYRCPDASCAGGPQQLPATNLFPHVVADETAVFFADALGLYRLAP